jgi:hypothetical protein
MVSVQTKAVDFFMAASFVEDTNQFNATSRNVKESRQEFSYSEGDGNDGKPRRVPVPSSSRKKLTIPASSP